LDKLKAQGWYELFTNTQMGCSQPDVAEFYVNVTLSGDVLTSIVNRVLIEVNAQALACSRFTMEKVCSFMVTSKILPFSSKFVYESRIYTTTL